MTAPRKQPVVHCVIRPDFFGELDVFMATNADDLADDPDNVSDAITNAGFREGDQVSIVMRRSGPKQTKRKRVKR